LLTIVSLATPNYASDKYQLMALASSVANRSISHAMLFYQFARVVWREVKQVVALCLNRKIFFSNKQWLFDFLSHANDLQATALALGFYLIW
jgi:hypothetical protein